MWVPDDSEQTAVRSQDGIELVNLEVLSSGDRSCYHTYYGSVKNTTEQKVTDLTIELSVLNENGRVLARFPISFTELAAGESVEFELENGPEKNGCWSNASAEDYEISVSYETATAG